MELYNAFCGLLMLILGFWYMRPENLVRVYYLEKYSASSRPAVEDWRQYRLFPRLEAIELHMQTYIPFHLNVRTHLPFQVVRRYILHILVFCTSYSVGSFPRFPSLGKNPSTINYLVIYL